MFLSLSRKKDRAMHMVIDPKAKYKLKWNVPLSDVDIVEYGPGVNILTSSYRTTISHSKEGRYTGNLKPFARNHHSELLHNTTNTNFHRWLTSSSEISSTPKIKSTRK